MQLQPHIITFCIDCKSVSEMKRENYSLGKISAKLESLARAYKTSSILVYNGFNLLHKEKIEAQKL